MPLLTLAEMKRQMHMTHSFDDTRISENILAAEAIVLDFIEKQDGFWLDFSPGEDSPPQVLIAAAKMVCESLCEDGFEGDPLSDRVKNLLRRFRDPAVS